MSALSLEPFDAAPVDDSGPNATYQEGYEDGLRAGLAAAQADSTALHASLVQAISDVDFSYAEARAQLLTALQPLFATITEKLLPQCIGTGFPAHILDELNAAANSGASGPMRIHVHPDQQDAVRKTAECLKTDISVGADPSLDLHAAWIQCGNAEAKLDLDRLLAQITQALEPMMLSQDRTNTDG